MSNCIRPKRRFLTRAVSRWFNPPAKAPKPTIDQRQLAEWTKFCMGQPSTWRRGHPTASERP